MTNINQDVLSIGEVRVPFYDDNLIVQLGEDGEVYVALRPIVESLGLSWGSQLNRVRRDAVLNKKLKVLSVFITNTQGDGQSREVACLPKQYISGFLFGISANRIKKERGVQGRQYGILTAVLHRGAFGMTPSYPHAQPVKGENGRCK